MKLKNNTAVVTGASSGIGKAIALALVEEGTTLCGVGRNLNQLEAAFNKEQATNPNIFLHQADLTSDEDIHQLTKNIQAEFGQVDLLVHSAGIFISGRFDTASVTELDWQYRLNVRAPYLLTQALLPLIKPCQGQIVFINSSAGLNASAGVGQYAATKHALKAIADSLRGEVNAEGVRVISVYPGRTASPMQEKIFQQEGREYAPNRLLQPEDIASTLITVLGLPRTAEVTDIHVRPLKKLNH